MEFISEMSEVEFVNSFKWKINVWNIERVLYEEGDVFGYRIKSEVMDFPKVDAKWTVEVTEIPYCEYEREDPCSYEIQRYFAADFKVKPSDASFNEIFSFELKVQNVIGYKKGNAGLFEQQIKFMLPQEEPCIKIEAFCRVRKMVTTFRQISGEDRSYRSELTTPSPPTSPHSFYHSLVEDHGIESYQQNRMSDSPLLVDENDAAIEQDYDYVSDANEEEEPNGIPSISRYINGSMYEDAYSEAVKSSQNSSFEKIEESSQEAASNSPSSVGSKAKSETGTDFACLESIPDEEEAAAARTLQESLKKAIDRLLMSNKKVEHESISSETHNLLKMPFFSNRDATPANSMMMGETSTIVQNRITKKLCFADFYPETTVKAAEDDATQPQVISAEIQKNSSNVATIEEIPASQAAPEVEITPRQPNVFYFYKDYDTTPRVAPKEYFDIDYDGKTPCKHLDTACTKNSTADSVQGSALEKSTDVVATDDQDSGADVKETDFSTAGAGTWRLTPIQNQFFERQRQSPAENSAKVGDTEDSAQGGVTADSADATESGVDVAQSSSTKNSASIAPEEDDIQKLIRENWREAQNNFRFLHLNKRLGIKTSADDDVHKSIIERISSLHLEKMKQEADNRANLFILGVKVCCRTFFYPEALN